MSSNENEENPCLKYSFEKFTKQIAFNASNVGSKTSTLTSMPVSRMHIARKVIQRIVSFFAWMLTKLLNISGQESLAVTGNIFLGQTEAPLLVKGYLDKMNRSEYFVLMTGGMATVAGSVLAAFIGFLGGDDPVQRIEVAKKPYSSICYGCPWGNCDIKNYVSSNRENK